MTKKKVGVFGGSFDPIHFGHLNLAVSLMETCALSEVLFIPTSCSAFKENVPPVASAEHRLEMLKLALASVKGFRVLDWEIHSQGPSYMIDTVRRLSCDPQVQLHLLIGEDHQTSLYRWKEAKELIRLSPPLIGCRKNNLETATRNDQVMQDIQSEYVITKEIHSHSKDCVNSPFPTAVSRIEDAEDCKNLFHIPLFEISSTTVRKRLIQNKYCGHLVPSQALDYIQKNNLYLLK